MNPKYLECVPWYIDFWLSQTSRIDGVIFQPLVLIVAEELPESLKPYSEYCELIHSTLPGAFVSQNIRTLYAGLVDSDLVVTSDVDMLTMNSKLVDTALSKWPSNCLNLFAVLRDVLPEGQYPICYSIASPKIWSELFDVYTLHDVNRTLKILFEKLNSSEYQGSHGGYGWFIDQEFLYETVTKAQSSGQITLMKLNDSQTGHKRLDRAFHRGIIKWLAIPLIINEHYSDYHVHHPVERNIRYLSALLKLKKNIG